MALSHRNKGLVALVCAGLIAGTAIPAPAVASTGTRPVTPISVTNSAGADLAVTLESTEKQNWGLTPTLPPTPLKLTTTAAQQLTTVKTDLRTSATDSRGLVDVAGVDVSISDSIVVASSPTSTTVAYDVHFVRDVVELPAGEDWEEVMSYTLELSATGQVIKMTVQDLEWQLENVPADFMEDPEDPTGEGSETGIEASPVITSGTPPTELPVNPPKTDPVPGLPPQPGPNAVEPPTVGIQSLTTAKKKTVVNYALKWWNSKNKSYPTNYGNDCTNFVSQALHAGGWWQNTGFYQSNKSWWARTWGPPYASYPWGGAENFYRYARVESKRATSLKYVSSLVAGDVLQYKGKTSNVMNHSMVVTKKVGNVPYLTYHTNNTKNKPFTALKKQNVTWFAHRI